MRKHNAANLRNSLLGSGFFLFCIGCMAGSGLPALLSEGNKPLPEGVAKPTEEPTVEFEVTEEETLGSDIESGNGGAGLDSPDVQVPALEFVPTSELMPAFAAGISNMFPARPVCSAISPALTSVSAQGGSYTFSTSCTPLPISYLWTVDGRPVSTESRLNYTFPANNTGVTRSYTISFVARNSGGITGPIQRVITQASGAPPVCSALSPDITSVPVGGASYTFTASCANLPASYQWVVNGVVQSSGSSTMRYTFPANNTEVTRSYTISFVARNSSGISASIQKVVTQPAPPRSDPPLFTPIQGSMVQSK